MFSDSWQTSHAVMRTKKKEKKKSFEIITASFNTAHIDWSGIRIIYWCK